MRFVNKGYDVNGASIEETKDINGPWRGVRQPLFFFGVNSNLYALLLIYGPMIKVVT